MNAEMWLSNGIVLAVLFGGLFLFRSVRRNRLWREAARELGRRRPIALAVIAIYAGVALADAVLWIGGAGGAAEASVAAAKPRSVIDRVLSPDVFKEKSYSAPLATREFYGGAALVHPGAHLLGTDVLGRDILYLTLKGVKVALLIGGLTTLIIIPLALLFGVSAGYFGGRTDGAVFFLISTLGSIPNLLLLIALIMALGRGTLQVSAALGITGWVGFSRLVRAETLKVRELDYIEAARALGVRDGRIILRHILPNLMHLVVITFVLIFTALVLSETILAYLGVGVEGSWGQMIDQARDELSRDPIIWWNLASASAALFILVLAVNLVGDGLRDILDPRTLREGQ